MGQRITIGQEAFHLASHNSVYQAEVTAIDRAAQMLTRGTMWMPPKVYILSDSKSALMSLQRHWQEKRTVNKLIDSLNELGSRVSVTLRWVKAHADCEGNNTADRIAKIGACPDTAAMEGFPVTDIDDVPVPYSQLKILVDQAIIRLWTDKWKGECWGDGRPKYRQTRHWLSVPNKIKSYELIKLDRDKLGKCMQFITGHAHMNRHQNLVDSVAGLDDREVTPPTCRLCGQGEETPLHLATDCDEIIFDARNILGCLGIYPNPRDPRICLKWGVEKLVQFLNLPILQPLLGGKAEEEEEDEQQQEEQPPDNDGHESDHSGTSDIADDLATLRDLSLNLRKI